ncbi:MAG TPA: mechanosensitive ion channel domain-containing protein [Candidatus Binatia bacterium]|nr:mechanosensitive ion channel domain-containing protein [Candidatus Binatia bacterium]
MAIAELWSSFIALLKPLASNLVVAVVLLLIGVVIAKLLERFIVKMLHELELDRWLRKSGVKFALEQTIGIAIRYFVYFITIVVALNQIGWTSFVVKLLAAVIFVLILAAILLGVKDFVPNFIAGIRIHQRGFVKEGDIIRVRDIEGEVRQVNLLDTRIKTVTGDLLFVPNSMLTKHEVLRHKRRKTMIR